MYDSVRQAITRSPRILDPDSPGPAERPSPFYLNATNAGAASPKMAEADMGPAMEESPISIMNRRRSRNHQRGYFDLDCGSSPLSSPSVKRTPTGSPVGTRLSLTALELMTGESPKEGEGEGERAQVWLALERGGSEESTPSETSNSNSESSQQSSPSTSPREENQRTFGFAGVRSYEGESYSSFLNKCVLYSFQFLRIVIDLSPTQVLLLHRQRRLVPGLTSGRDVTLTVSVERGGVPVDVSPSELFTFAWGHAHTVTEL